MDDSTIFVGVAAAPIITGLMQTLKDLIPPKLWQLSTVLAAVGWTVGYAAAVGDLTPATPFLGVVTGLAANGLYSASRTAVAAVRNEGAGP